jgi:hypothetical protein
MNNFTILHPTRAYWTNCRHVLSEPIMIVLAIQQILNVLVYAKDKKFFLDDVWNLGDPQQLIDAYP